MYKSNIDQLKVDLNHKIDYYKRENYYLLADDIYFNEDDIEMLEEVIENLKIIKSLNEKRDLLGI